MWIPLLKPFFNFFSADFFRFRSALQLHYLVLYITVGYTGSLTTRKIKKLLQRYATGVVLCCHYVTSHKSLFD